MNKKIGIAVLLGCILVGMIAGVAALTIFKKDNRTGSSTVTESNRDDNVAGDESIPVEIVDADAYYEQNATVISVTDANTSEEVIIPGLRPTPAAVQHSWTALQPI